MKLYRYQKQLSKDSLKDVIIKDDVPKIEETGYQANLEDVTDYASEIIELQNTGGLKGKSEMDAKLAPGVYAALKHLNRRTLTDPFMWHWLTTTLFKDYVTARWWDQKGDFDSWLETGGAAEHFLGSNSNVGFSRNAIARLFWASEKTCVDNSFELTEKVLMDTDLYSGLFERDLGMESRLVRLCIEKMEDITEGQKRESLKVIRMRMGSTPVEAFNDALLENFVEEAIGRAIQGI